MTESHKTHLKRLKLLKLPGKLLKYNIIDNGEVSKKVCE